MNKLFKFIFVNIFVFFLISFSKIYAVDIQSPAAVVICEESGRILYDKNCNEQRKMASLTKLMTSILLVENCDLDEKITVEKQACYIGGSEAGISPNDEVTARDLLYGMLLPSGNDCALAVAYHVGGNIENFAMLMNEKAKELGLTKTSFANPHGLDNDSHYTTAYEMALITRYARKYDIIKKVASTTETNVTFGNKSVNLRNTNRLLRTYPKATGMKTGFTNGANRCLAASASYNNLNLIAVVLGSDTSDIRFNDAKSILEDTFSKYHSYDISNFLNIYVNIPVIKGKKENYIRSYSDTKVEALTEDEYSKIYVSQNFISKIEAPLCKGTYLGTYTVSVNNEILYSKDIYLEEDIEKKTLMDYFYSIFYTMFDRLEKI